MKRGRVSLLAIALVAAASVEAHAQFLARPTAGIFGGLTTPRGDFGNEVANGWNAGVMIKARLYRALDLRVDGTYAKFGREHIVIPLNPTDTVVFDTDATLPFATLDAHLNLGPDSAEYPGDNTITPHILGGIGVYELDYKITCAGVCGFETVPKQKHMGLNVGGGATIPLGPVRTFVEARYHRVSRKPEDGDAFTLITLSAGIRIR
jgi:hypothetical protein